MPIIWRFLLKQYVKVLILSVTAFISILLTTRLEDIAHFAALGADGWRILLFAFYQIPYILPIAIPISCLISAILLVQRLSTTHELTALRSCGMALRQFLAPILFAGAFVGLLNFYIVSEVATDSHLSSAIMKAELRSINPLLLLNNKHTIKMKGFYLNTMGASVAGESADHVIMAMPNKSNERINLMIAGNLKANAENFVGQNLTFVTSMAGDPEKGYDHLVIENIDRSDTSVEDFTNMMQAKTWTLNNDHLKMSLLLAKLKEENDQKEMNRGITEIIRRLSVGLSAFTFTLMGASFGVGISRNRSNRSIFVVIALAALYMSSYFIAKGIDHNLIASALVYTVPQLLIVAVSIAVLSRASRGIE